jgi:hypothetical protein
VQIRRAATHTIEHYTEALASTCNVAIFAPGGDALLASTAATVDPASQSITSGLAGGRTITVANTSAFTVGRRYRILVLDGRSVDLLLIAKTAADLTFDAEIPWTSTAGTVRAQRVSVSFTAPDATTRSCRAVWTYGTAEEVDIIDIVRMPFALIVSEQRVVDSEQLYVDTLGHRPARHIAQASRDVELWLRGQQIYPDLVIDRSMLEQAVVWRALYIRHIRDEELRGVFGKEYESALSAFKLSRSWYDSDDDLQRLSEKDPSQQPPIRYVRVG